MNQKIGQGSFEFEPPQQSPEQLEIDLTKRFATSSLIKFIAYARNIDPQTINPEVLDFITPAEIEDGIYLPRGKKDREIDLARGPVIFPADEYKLLTKSPIHIANSASVGVKKARINEDDKENVDKTAKRASGHALESQLQRVKKLESELKDKEDALKVIRKEVFTAKGTGYYAHFPASKMLPLISLAEVAIFDALNVSATTGGWKSELYKDAKKALEYQLFGLHKQRYANWRAYTPMVQYYTYKRRMVAKSTITPIEKELKKYQPFLEPTNIDESNKE